MKILILTTPTTHHAKFIKNIQLSFNDIIVYLETKSRSLNNYNTNHILDIEQEKYEKKLWFPNKNVCIKNIVKTFKFESLNSDICMKQMIIDKPEIIIVFGTGILSKKFISLAPKHLYNLHGGDPEMYRGLDTHFWAIFHKDFNNLYTTLHRVDENLDTGNIIYKEKLLLKNISDLYKLRAYNTQICCDLVLKLLNLINQNNSIKSYKQKSIGRYYSAMPSSLKDDCIKKFNDLKKNNAKS